MQLHHFDSSPSVRVPNYLMSYGPRVIQISDRRAAAQTAATHKTARWTSTVHSRRRVKGESRRGPTFRPPVFSFMGVRKGSKIMWLVSMFTGDWRFPTEHRFQAEFTNPQNDGTAIQSAEWGGSLLDNGWNRTPPPRKSTTAEMNMSRQT